MSDKFISGIHDYCDRRCERGTFMTRCWVAEKPKAKQLMTEENFANIEPPISLLKDIKQKVETKFPNARDFVRPGFDEVETVM